MEKLLSRLPERLHHHAYVVADQEVNRQFFEELLGLPLVATWCETHQSPWVGREVAMCHTFYAMADGGALAFFSFADERSRYPTRRMMNCSDGWNRRARGCERRTTAIAGRCTAHPRMDSSWNSRWIHRTRRRSTRSAAPMHTPSWRAGWLAITARTTN
jgi:hypothetical protein